MAENRPIVSVLMPAYNASKTIGFALASLFSQTYTQWECIIVDDGSTDQSVEIIQAISDPRIKLIVLGKNYGRGVARKVSLENATGKYVTMLDADDWLYPDKLATQVDFLERNPDVALHSMAMAIVDGDKLVSIRRPEADMDMRLDVLHRTFIPHAPSMIRRSAIGDITYDSRFKLAQDQDFLRRVLVRKRYFVSTEVGYSYTELQSVGIGKIVKGYFYNSRGYLKLFSDFGVKALFFSALEIAKIFYTLSVFAIRGERYILDSRSNSPLSDDVDKFRYAVSVVKDSFVNIGLRKGFS